jgi:hypothetical protein
MCINLFICSFLLLCGVLKIMLKALQVDGDTDSAAVLEDFCSVMSSLMSKAEAGENAGPPNGVLGDGMEILPPTAGAYHPVIKYFI